MISKLNENVIQSTSSAARGLLLVLSLVVFAAAWESDTPQGRTQGLVRRFKPQAPAVRVTRLEQVAADSSRPQLPAVRQRIAANAPKTARLVLPEGLKPGTYRVVNSEGGISMLVMPGPVDHSSPKYYVVENDRSTTCFIRIPAGEMAAD